MKDKTKRQTGRLKLVKVKTETDRETDRDRQTDRDRDSERRQRPIITIKSRHLGVVIGQFCSDF